MAACTVSWKSHPHMMDAMAKDTLFLIAPGFEDPKHPGVRFVCPHCNQIEGLLVGLALDSLEARFAPTPGECCVQITERS